ncbi:hypothetical protein DAMA08_052420 [Martiniozyma asiatica (nom. inval.)]|nr:hypothetical protein DAMA08_052420 [Martiniozyma asiatica]
MVVPQIFCRLPRSVNLFQAQPAFEYHSGFKAPSDGSETRCAAYSPDGRYFCYSQPDGLRIVDPLNGSLLFTIPLDSVMEMSISPLGNFITTWSPVGKNEDGTWKENAANIKIDINNKTFEIIRKFINKSQSGWIPQFTADEKFMALMASPYVIDFYRPSERKSLYSLNFKDTGKIESFQLSQGKNPSVAVFIPGVKGNPAYIRVYSLPNVKSPVTQKSFFKGESCTFKWNSLGTSLLALVSTDVDDSNRSYYGETQLYLLGISGSFDQKIDLPKEGPIHEVTWSPTSREFAVIHGFMPAAITFFDARGNKIHSLPEAARNTILYSPHAKYILVAGFGNLPGEIDILDRQNKFAKVASFTDPNTSVCQWSPDGRYLLTATTSPRLRVDNGFRIWSVKGKCLYRKLEDVLYNVDWRFQSLSDLPANLNANEEIEPHQSAKDWAETQKATKTVKGAYRPPNRRSATTNSGKSKSLSELNKEKNGGGRATPQSRERTIPGWNPVQAAPKESKSAAKNRKKRAGKSDESPTTNSEALNGDSTASTAAGVIGGVFSLEEKKIRNLLKKLRAIEQLKIKKDNGDHLEETQILKIGTEDNVRKELESLGWKEE